jgi:hypothetical protein
MHSCMYLADGTYVGWLHGCIYVPGPCSLPLGLSARDLLLDQHEEVCDHTHEACSQMAHTKYCGALPHTLARVRSRLMCSQQGGSECIHTPASSLSHMRTKLDHAVSDVDNHCMMWNARTHTHTAEVFPTRWGGNDGIAPDVAPPKNSSNVSTIVEMGDLRAREWSLNHALDCNFGAVFKKVRGLDPQPSRTHTHHHHHHTQTPLSVAKET